MDLFLIDIFFRYMYCTIKHRQYSICIEMLIILGDPGLKQKIIYFLQQYFLFRRLVRKFSMYFCDRIYPNLNSLNINKSLNLLKVSKDNHFFFNLFCTSAIKITIYLFEKIFIQYMCIKKINKIVSGQMIQNGKKEKL